MLKLLIFNIHELEKNSQAISLSNPDFIKIAIGNSPMNFSPSEANAKYHNICNRLGVDYTYISIDAGFSLIKSDRRKSFPIINRKDYLTPQNKIQFQSFRLPYHGLFQFLEYDLSRNGIPLELFSKIIISDLPNIMIYSNKFFEALKGYEVISYEEFLRNPNDIETFKIITKD